MGLCPFHKDTNPSLSIDPVKNEWHCKGACGEGGDVIEWVKRAEGVSFNHALELLKRDYLSLRRHERRPAAENLDRAETAAADRAHGGRQEAARNRGAATTTRR
jgi:DNA primase